MFSIILLIGFFGCQIDNEVPELTDENTTDRIINYPPGPEGCDIVITSNNFQWAISDSHKTKNIYFKVYVSNTSSVYTIKKYLKPDFDSWFSVSSPNYRYRKLDSSNRWWYYFYYNVAVDRDRAIHNQYYKQTIQLNHDSDSAIEAYDNISILVC
jgi:hypothetical protein